MAEKCILISGREISHDLQLRKALKHLAKVMINDDNARLSAIQSPSKIDLVLMEIQTAGRDLTALRSLKVAFPEIPVILVQGSADREAVASGVALGAEDAFRMPLKTHLVAERLGALLTKHERHPELSCS